MSILHHWRDTIAGAAASVAGAVANVRGGALKQGLATLRAGGVTERRRQAILVGMVALMLSVLVWLSARTAIGQFGERDFEIRAVCAACGYDFASSRNEMIDASLAAQKQGHAGAGASMTAPIGVCPRCGKLATYRARQCPKCGKPVAPPFATVDGHRVVPKCRDCGWSAQPQ